MNWELVLVVTALLIAAAWEIWAIRRAGKSRVFVKDYVSMTRVFVKDYVSMTPEQKDEFISGGRSKQDYKISRFESLDKPLSRFHRWRGHQQRRVASGPYCQGWQSFDIFCECGTRFVVVE